MLHATFCPKPQHFCATTSQLHSTKVVMCCTLFSFYLLQLLCVYAGCICYACSACPHCPLSRLLLHVCAFACFHFIKIATVACCQQLCLLVVMLAISVYVSLLLLLLFFKLLFVCFCFAFASSVFGAEVPDCCAHIAVGAFLPFGTAGVGGSQQ